MKNNLNPQQMSEEQKPDEQATPEQEALPASDALEQASEVPVAATRRRSAGKAVKVTPESEAAISPRLSFWPLLLAFALAVVLLSIVLESFIVLGIGVVVLLVSVIGWALERR